MSIFKKLRAPQSEADQLIERARTAAAVPLTPAHVGLHRALKIAYKNPASTDYGHVWPESDVRALARQVESFPGLGDMDEIYGRAVALMATYYRDLGFRADHIIEAMGESDPAVRTETGGWAIKVLGIAPHIGGDDNETDKRAFFAQTQREPASFQRVVAWYCMGLARLSKASKIPSLEARRDWALY